MQTWKVSLFVIAALFLLSLLGSFVLFQYLDSGGEGKYQSFSIEGALVGFVVVFGVLSGAFFRHLRHTTRHAFLEVHLVFGDDGPESLEGAQIFYQRLPNPGLHKAEFLELFDDPQTKIPSVAMDDIVRVWVKIDDKWWSSDTVSSYIRHLAFTSKPAPSDP